MPAANATAAEQQTVEYDLTTRHDTTKNEASSEGFTSGACYHWNTACCFPTQTVHVRLAAGGERQEGVATDAQLQDKW